MLDDIDAEIARLLGSPRPAVEEAGTVTAAQLGEWLGVSVATVHRLAREGVLARDPAGRFDLQPAVATYCAHLRDGARGRLAANPDLNAEKVRLAREQADKIAFANARARGELLDAREVATAWRSVVVDLRAALLAVPSRVASRRGLDRATTAALDSEIREALEAIADDRA